MTLAAVGAHEDADQFGAEGLSFPERGGHDREGAALAQADEATKLLAHAPVGEGDHRLAHDGAAGVRLEAAADLGGVEHPNLAHGERHDAYSGKKTGGGRF